MEQSSQRNSNLPVALSTFIGRQRETAAVQGALSDRRLVTLIGAGGSGKTRLALHVAEQAQTAFRDGVWLVELASLLDAALVPQLVADVLGIRETRGRAISDLLVDFLRARNVLLILDNCEHLVRSVALLVGRLLSESPDLKVLATSREPLGVPGEVVWAVPPLSLPAPQPWQRPIPEAERLAQYSQSEAVQLLLDRAATLVPGYALTAQNAPAIASICRLLDGMPLALELAAARLTLFSASEIAERLDDRFGLLTSGLRVMVPRHKTLKATLDWSHDLLSESEKVLFRRLAVFTGGWTMEASEMVCGFGELSPSDVMDLLAGLVAKSMVVAEQSDNARRYHYLETIKQYAAQKLDASDETDDLHRRHFDFFLQWAETHTSLGHGPEQLLWLRLLKDDWANLQSAFGWVEGRNGLETENLRLAIACSAFMDYRGFLSDDQDILSRLLAGSSAQVPAEIQTRALLDASLLTFYQGDPSAARALAAEALLLTGRLGDPGKPLRARAFMHIGDYSIELGDYVQAGPALEQALALYLETGSDRESVALARFFLGLLATREGDYERAEQLLVESMAGANRPEAPGNLALIYGALGELYVRLGRYEDAQAYLEQSLRIREELDAPWSIAAVLGTLGWVAMQRQEFEQMRNLLRRSIEMRLEIGEHSGIAWCLEKLAQAIAVETQSFPVAMRRRQDVRSAQVAGAAAALRASRRSVINPTDLPSYEGFIAYLRTSIGNETFQTAFAEGETMALKEAIDMALEPPDTSSLSVKSSLKAQYSGLTTRERETAVLIAQGKTNREIAAALTVGEKTVETYITRILNKLGVNSRVQIATWALRAGLLDEDKLG